MSRPIKLVDARASCTGGGILLNIGRCGCCGRFLNLHTANKVGVRCRYEGAQYDRLGYLLWDAATPQEEIARRRKLAYEQQAQAGDSNPVRIKLPTQPEPNILNTK